MQPAQYPMKNIALTTARFVLPLEFEAVKDSSGDMTAVIHDASTMLAGHISEAQEACTYKPGRSNHTPASINREAHEEYATN